MQKVVIQSRPFVRRLSLNSGSATVPHGPSDQDSNISCAMTLGIFINNILQENVTVSPFLSTLELEYELRKLNNSCGISVLKSGYEGKSDMFWNNEDTLINLVLVHWPCDIPSADGIPMLVVTSNPTCNGNATDDFEIEFTSEILQNMSYPDSFALGFNKDLTIERFTEQLPLNTSGQAIQEALTGLLSWDCTTEDNLDGKTKRYYSYEDSESGGVGDNTTSFCGFYSKNNPRTIWEGPQTYSLSMTPYVSLCNIIHCVLTSIAVSFALLPHNPGIMLP